MDETSQVKWQATKQPCNNCGHVQVSVHPVVCEYLECSVCHHMNPAPYVQESEKTMDTRTGLIHEMQPGETLRDLERRLNAQPGDLVPVARQADGVCPKCKGTGAVRRGMFSKRFKPCVCVA